jgi:DNA-directed RNA polymerase subunit RPC12/RpoP
MANPLHYYQEQAKRDLISVLFERTAALDGSDTGIGKTYTACGVIKSLELPTLAVIPKIAITGWQAAADHVGTELDVINWEMLRTGRTPFGWWDHPRTAENARYKCARCLEEVELEDYLQSLEAGTLAETELGCRCNSGGEHTLIKVKKHHYGKFNLHPGIRFLVFDEVHRGNAMKSLNAEMLIAAKRQGVFTLALSATPAASPLQFRALGYLLGMHELTGDAGFYAWSRGLGCRRHPVFKQWEWMAPKSEQNQIMANLSRLIFPRFGVRLRAEDIPGFPKRRIQANLFDLEGFKKLDELYDEMRDALLRLKDRKSRDMDPTNPLTVDLRCRQEIELLKIPPAVELTRDYLGKGFAVALFVNFSETLAELRRRLECDCYIDGTQTGAPALRQAHIDRFQSNESRVIIVNNQAGGECCNLHDIRGEFPCVGLVMPPPSAQRFKQLVGRLRRSGGKSLALYRVIFAAKTKEVQSHRKLSLALNNIDALMDSDLVPDNLSDLI